MANLSGATEVGGVIVPIGLNLPQLIADAAKVRGILDSLDKNPPTIRIKVDSAGTMKAKGEVSDIYKFAEGKSFEIKFGDESIRKIKRDMEKLSTDAEGIGEKTGRSHARGFEKGLNELGGGSGGGEGGHGGGGGHGNLARKNLLSARGLEGLGIGGSATAAFAIIEAMKIAGELAEANNIASHPERIAREMMGPGGTMDFDSVTRGSRTIAESQASQKRLEAFSSIPILGSIVKIGDAVTDYSGGLKDQEAQAKRQIQADEFLRKSQASRDIALASFEGDKVGAIRHENLEKLRPLQNEVNAGYGTHKFADPEDAKRFIAADANANRQLQEQEFHNQLIEKRAEQDRVAELTKSRGGAGAELRSVGIGQSARLAGFDEETGYKGDSKARVTERARLVEEQELQILQITRRNTATIAANDAQSKSSMLTADQKFYAAKRATMESAAEAEITDLTNKGASIEVIQSAQRRHDAASTAETIEHNREITDAIQTSEVNIRASSLSIMGAITKNPELAHQAQQIQRSQSQELELRKIEDPGQREARERELAAGNFQQDFIFSLNRKRQLEQEGMQITARTESAKLEAKDEPLAAQARQQRLAAEMAVRNADPANIAAVRDEQHAILEAARHKLFDPRSGGVASLETSFFMPGDPLGSAQIQIDKEEAAKQLQEANKNVDQIQPQDFKEFSDAALKYLAEIADNATGFVLN